jgi:hypothetical protein
VWSAKKKRYLAILMMQAAKHIRLRKWAAYRIDGSGRFSYATLAIGMG